MSFCGSFDQPKPKTWVVSDSQRYKRLVVVLNYPLHMSLCLVYGIRHIAEIVVLRKYRELFDSSVSQNS